MKEEWKRYRDTNYEVSNLGTVKNAKTNHILAKTKKYNGKKENDYERVKMEIDGKRKNKPVHRLVAECFLDNYSESLEVNHRNSLRYDNRVENLEMTTKEENYQHSIKFGNGSQRKPVLAIDEEGNILEFKSLWAGGRFIKERYKKVQEIDKICWNIKQNLTGKCKSAYGYKWQFIDN